MMIPTVRNSSASRSSAPLAARTPGEAVRTFVSAFQQALSCLTLARLNAEGYRPIDLPYRAALQDGEPVALGGSTLQLLIVVRYQIVRAATMSNAWAVQLAAYDYETLMRMIARSLRISGIPRAAVQLPGRIFTSVRQPASCGDP